MWLAAVPPIYINDLYAKPLNVLDATARCVEITCTIDAKISGKQARIIAELCDGDSAIARSERNMHIANTGRIEYSLTLTGIGDAKLWSPDSPQLYTVIAKLGIDGQAVHNYKTRIGFREAKFTLDGFSLMGNACKYSGSTGTNCILTWGMPSHRVSCDMMQKY